MKIHREYNHEREVDKGFFSAPNYSRFEGQTDTYIWQAFLTGDEGALVYIYRKYSGILFNYGCQFTSNRESVGDVVQELFLDLIRKRNRLGLTTSIKFYLFRSLRRRLARQLKKESRLAFNEKVPEVGFLLDFGHEQSTIDQDNLQEEVKKKLKYYCNQLPVRQREAVLLFFYEGLSYQEVAELMELGQIKSARTLIYRAIENLTQRIQISKDEIFKILLLIAPSWTT